MRPRASRTRTTLLAALIMGGVATAAFAQPAASAVARHQSKLHPPKTTTAQDARYLTDVAQADADLVSYVNKYGNGALQGMLTDGLAFCAFLRGGGGIDNALVNEAVGARADEKHTHLPLNVHTFNTIESLALIDLCPGEQRLVPSSVRSKLTRLGGALRSPASSP
jgi:hypothetical protein